jgi:lipoic acid synthetase
MAPVIGRDGRSTITVFDLGTVEYEEACRLQEAVALARGQGALGDTLLLVEHPPVITIGQGGGEEDILVPLPALRRVGVGLCRTDRGGLATYHGPGQLVAYPILKRAHGDLHRHVWQLEEAAIRLLAGYGLEAGRLAEHPGAWLDGKKVASVGIAVRDEITRHGIALNVAPDMAAYDLLIPCGLAGRSATSMAVELGSPPDPAQVARRFVQAFGEVFDCRMVEEQPAALYTLLADPAAQPAWLWQRISPATEVVVAEMEDLLDGLALHTVCQEARCPNLAECFGRGTATFLILGDTCTRGCRFCAVRHGLPARPDPGEPERVAEAAARLGLGHVVVTSVTRDDLADGGAGQFVATVQALRRRLPAATVEVLIPDLAGSQAALEVVVGARPDVLNHNLETVSGLYPRVRPGAGYRRSLALLARAKALAPGLATKTGLMLGLGERTAEVLQALHDLRQTRCDLLTLGQYLQPTAEQLPVGRYLSPEEFAWYGAKARGLGLREVAAGPLVRSSYHAGALYRALSRQ